MCGPFSNALEARTGAARGGGEVPQQFLIPFGSGGDIAAPLQPPETSIRTSLYINNQPRTASLPVIAVGWVNLTPLTDPTLTITATILRNGAVTPVTAAFVIPTATPTGFMTAAGVGTQLFAPQDRLEVRYEGTGTIVAIDQLFIQLSFAL